jgi:glutathione synthase/RimK-type ligase-like ATP-grasp enzyme
MKLLILRRPKLGRGSTQGIKRFLQHPTFKIRRNDKVKQQPVDLLVRWGCTSTFPATKTLNKAEAISLANNKRRCRQLFQEKNISAPKLFNINEITENDFPVIVRPESHSRGKNIYLCNSFIDLANADARTARNNYISKYIAKDREFGVFVFNNRITSVIEKMPKTANANNSIAWNVAQGTHAFENVNWENWPLKACVLALKSINAVGLDFGRVDIVQKDNEFYVLEVNSAHSLTSDYRQECYAKALDYYIENGEVENKYMSDEDFKKIKSFKSIIHPALRENSEGLNT